MATEPSDCTIALESPENLSAYWRNSQSPLRWNCFFVLPSFLEIWWREFGAGFKLHSCVVKQGGAVIGIAPLCLKGAAAYFLGSPDVCDCLDFVVAPGAERPFFHILLDTLSREEVTSICLNPVRPDSSVLVHLLDVAKDRGHSVRSQKIGVSLELNLPSTWEDYLAMLHPKHRHEVRRKLRRLQEHGVVTFRTLHANHDAAAAANVFLHLFRKSANGKKAFMTTKMESFFRSLTMTMAQLNLLSMGVLNLNGNPVAAVLCFDYDGIVYLYNNGYDPDYRTFSVGLISKIMSIKDSIERGRKKYDFLKGGEAYKYRLGGKEVPLYACEVLLK